MARLASASALWRQCRTFLAVFALSLPAAAAGATLEGERERAAHLAAGQGQGHVLNDLYTHLGGADPEIHWRRSWDRYYPFDPMWECDSSNYVIPPGINCKWQGNSIEKINLSGYGLQGALPASLAELTQLLELDLGDNALTGPFPDLGSLKLLKRFKIAKNPGFAGFTLPDMFTVMDGLLEVDASNCGFTGPLPASLSARSQLVDVFLDANKFTGSVNAFDKLEGLRALHLAGNALTGKLTPESVNPAARLNSLHLDGNRLECPVPPYSSPAWWQSNGGHQRMRNGLKSDFNPTGHCPGFCPTATATRCEILGRRICHSNDVCGECVDYTASPEVVSATAACETVSPDVHAVNALVRAMVTRNRFLAGYFKGWPFLELCTQGSNSRDSPPSGIKCAGPGDTGRVASIDVRGDFRETEGDLSLPHVSIPSSWGPEDLSELAVLSISSAELTGSLGPWVGRFRNLRTLKLDRNALSGELPEALFSLTALEHLDLSANDFEGVLSPAIANMQSLSYLALSENPRLGGPLPVPELALLAAMETFEIVSCGFSGEFPYGVGNSWSNIKTFNVKANKFTCPIPDYSANRGATFRFWKAKPDAATTPRSDYQGSGLSSDCEPLPAPCGDSSGLGAVPRGKPCVFPFLFGGSWRYSCVPGTYATTGNSFHFRSGFCSLTTDLDRDGLVAGCNDPKTCSPASCPAAGSAALQRCHQLNRFACGDMTRGNGQCGPCKRQYNSTSGEYPEPGEACVRYAPALPPGTPDGDHGQFRLPGRPGKEMGSGGRVGDRCYSGSHDECLDGLGCFKVSYEDCSSSGARICYGGSHTICLPGARPGEQGVLPLEGARGEPCLRGSFGAQCSGTLNCVQHTTKAADYSCERDSRGRTSCTTVPLWTCQDVELDPDSGKPTHTTRDGRIITREEILKEEKKKKDAAEAAHPAQVTALTLFGVFWAAALAFSVFQLFHFKTELQNDVDGKSSASTKAKGSVRQVSDGQAGRHHAAFISPYSGYAAPQQAAAAAPFAPPPSAAGAPPPYGFATPS